MRTRLLVGLAVIALLAGGCADGEREGAAKPVGPLPGAPVVAEHSYRGSVIDAYQVGDGVEPGVYTSSAHCTGIVASSAAYDLFEIDSTDDDFLRGSVQVGDRSRVVVKRGEYLHLEVGCTWQREDPAGPRTPDPRTRAGACAILLGPDGLAGAAVAALKAAAAGDSGRVGGVQERLMAVVLSRTKDLSWPAGELIDALDAPKAFVEHGEVDPRVTRAVARIHQVCGRA